MILHRLRVRLRPRRVAGLLVVTAGVVTLGALSAPCSAQEEPMREMRVLRAPGGVTLMRGAPANRAVLGVMLGEGSSADTAGVRLESVEPNGPAAKAGLKAGDVITQINGVSLKVAKEDAEDLALAGLAQRRLQRVMAKAKPGDEVALQVRSGSTSRSVTVKAVSPDALQDNDTRIVERVITRGPDGQIIERRSGAPRGMVGMSIGGAGNRRDTLGLFINSVVTGGPAEKAGIVEGERIAAVNGVDVRVPREDTDDEQSLSARVERFVREVQKVEPGKTLSLRVYGNGRYREVTVTAAAATDFPQEGLQIRMGDGEFRVRTPRPPMPPMPPTSPRQPRVFEFNSDGPRARIRVDGEALEFDGMQIEQMMQEMGRTLRDRFRGMETELFEAPIRSGVVRRTGGRAAVL
jgi:S1-C subfamily serine protease